MSPVSGSAVAGVAASVVVASAVVVVAVPAARLFPPRCVKVKLNLLVHEGEELPEFEALKRVLEWTEGQETSL